MRDIGNSACFYSIILRGVYYFWKLDRLDLRDAHGLQSPILYSSRTGIVPLESGLRINHRLSLPLHRHESIDHDNNNYNNS